MTLPFTPPKEATIITWSATRKEPFFYVRDLTADVVLMNPFTTLAKATQWATDHGYEVRNG